MSWGIVENRAGFEWAHWVDREAFNAWRSRLAQLVDLRFDARDWENSLRGRGLSGDRVPNDAAREAYFRGQRQYVVDLFECLSEMLRALNQPAYACPSYVAMWRGLEGGVRSDAGGGDATWYQDAYRAMDATSQVARDQWANDGPGFFLSVLPRLRLTADSLVDSSVADATRAPPPSYGAEGSRGVWAWCNVERNDFYRWCATLSLPLEGGPNRGGSGVFLGRWHDALQLALGVAVGGRFADQSLDASAYVNRSRMFVAAKNLLEARRFGGVSEVDLVSLGSEADVLAMTASPGVVDFGNYARTIAAAIAVVNPIAGAAVLGLTYLPEALIALFGAAVGRTLDPFGRTEPVLELATLGGTITAARQAAPQYVVPAAPAVDPSRYPLTVERRRVALFPGAFIPAVVELGGSGQSGDGSGVRRLAVSPSSVLGRGLVAWGLELGAGGG